MPWFHLTSESRIQFQHFFNSISKVKHFFQLKFLKSIPHGTTVCRSCVRVHIWRYEIMHAVTLLCMQQLLVYLYFFVPIIDWHISDFFGSYVSFKKGIGVDYAKKKLRNFALAMLSVICRAHIRYSNFMFCGLKNTFFL